jgi:hypothetical protein
MKAQGIYCSITSGNDKAEKVLRCISVNLNIVSSFQQIR